MGIYDEDPGDWWKPGYSIKRWLTIGVIAVSLITSLVYLGRTTGITRATRRLTSVERLEKGSLRVNLNTATIEELQTLPGIGPAKAKLIAANRPYQSIDDLAELQGVGTNL